MEESTEAELEIPFRARKRPKSPEEVKKVRVKREPKTSTPTEPKTKRIKTEKSVMKPNRILPPKQEPTKDNKPSPCESIIDLASNTMNEEESIFCSNTSPPSLFDEFLNMGETDPSIKPSLTEDSGTSLQPQVSILLIDTGLY